MKIIFLALLAALPLLASDLAITNAKVYPSPSEAPLEHATILIHDGQIATVGASPNTTPPSGATILDGTGLVVTSGFWNSHVHFMPPGLLDAEHKNADALNSELEAMFTRWGFTTVFDIASSFANTNNIRQRVARGELKGPRIFTTGEPFYPEHGVPIYVKGYLAKFNVNLPDDASTQEAAARAARQLAAGADAVKLFVGSIQPDSVMLMPLDRAKAVVAEAHRVGKPAFAHPSNREGAEIAIRSGVDILAHVTTEGQGWNDDLIAQIMSAHMAVIPTLTLFDVEGKKSHMPAETLEHFINKGVTELRSYAKAGGTVLFGTDVGYIDVYDTTEEFTLMSRAGMNWRQILASLTTNPAARFQQKTRSGRIGAGFDGDLAILDSDPAQDPTAFAKVHYTIRRGEILYKRP